MSMTTELIEKLEGIAASEGLYDDKNPGKRAKILGEAIETIRSLSEWNSRELEVSSFDNRGIRAIRMSPYNGRGIVVSCASNWGR